jgi:hypothetical protein
MTSKLKQARTNILKSARELDKISKCSQAKHNVMTVAVKVLLKKFYKY